MGFTYSPSVDSIGGLICCWDSAHFAKSTRVCFPRFIAIKGSWIVGDGPGGLICVYASNE